MIKLGGTKTRPPKISSYPSYGFQTKDGDWLVNLLGVAYQTPPLNLRQRMLLKMLANVMKASDRDLQSETFRDRTWPFFVEPQSGYRMTIDIQGQRIRLQKKSRRNGHFDTWLRLDDGFVRSIAQVDGHDNLILDGRIASDCPASDCPASDSVDCQIMLLQSSGLSVVSDIDDTIKDSNVIDRRELLLNTFVRDFRCVEGMPELYRDWFAEGADFHYVSSSPWQLYTALEQMRLHFEFPIGTVHLRNFRLRDQFLKKLMFRRQGKALAIRKLLKNFPRRKFLLVGDSGEKDPEIYQKICRKFPDQIKGVFIRNVRGRELHGERLEKLKRCVGRNVCGVFLTPQQLRDQAQPIFERYGRPLAHAG